MSCRLDRQSFSASSRISHIASLPECLRVAFRGGLMKSRARGPLHISVTTKARNQRRCTTRDQQMTIQTHKDENQNRQSTDRKSGRAAFSDNGSTVWEWQTATGVFERQITDEKFAELTSPRLEIVEDSKLTPRKFEGLWIHDAHRPVRSVVPPPVRSEPRRLAGPLRELLRRLSGG